MRTSAEKIKKILPQPYPVAKTSLQQRSLTLHYDRTLSRLFEKTVPPHFSSWARTPEMVEPMLAFQKEGLPLARNKRGTTESYLLSLQEGTFALFKPIQLGQEGDARREVATYLIDHDHFAGVPQTCFLALDPPHFPERRLGACQEFVPHAPPVLRLTSAEQAAIHPPCVRRIALLDMRIRNLDRHTSNLLAFFEGSRVLLVPIDHALSFPDRGGFPYFGWIQWPQAQTPFNAEELDYIERLDPERDAALLHEEAGLAPSEIVQYMAATRVIQVAARMGWSVAAIASLFRRTPRCNSEGKRMRSFALFDTLSEMAEEPLKLEAFLANHIPSPSAWLPSRESLHRRRPPQDIQASSVHRSRLGLRRRDGFSLASLLWQRGRRPG